MLKNLQDIMQGKVEQALLRLWSTGLSEPEAAAIRSRAKADPGYREEYEASLDILAGMEELADDPEIRAIADEPQRQIDLRRTRQRAGLGIAASVLLAMGAALAYYSPWSGPDDGHLQKYFTRVGEQQTIDLEDGTVVTLNTATQLVVDYTNEGRRILLERGEAYFDVATDADRPFTVEMGVRSVTALGTEFSIRKHPGHYSVAVLEGTVSLHEPADAVVGTAPPVSADGQAVVLSAPDERRLEQGWVAEFDVSRNRLTAFQPDSMERYQGWRGGLLRFYREPLFEVVKELNRYTRKKILIEDAGIMNLNVYAAVRVKELESALVALEKLLPIEVTRHYDRIVITGSEKSAPAPVAGS